MHRVAAYLLNVFLFVRRASLRKIVYEERIHRVIAKKLNSYVIEFRGLKRKIYRINLKFLVTPAS